MIEVRPFRASYIKDAARLFSDAYEEARQVLPHIPMLSDVVVFAEEKLEKIAGNPGFAAFDHRRLVGYMVELFTNENFMGRPTGFIIELFPCASIINNRRRIYQLLYKEMSLSWIDRGFHAHQFSFLATDNVLAHTFFRLGFGMTHFQLFRDLAVPTGRIPNVDIRYLDREESIREIDKVHDAYYLNPPLFWIPHNYFGNGDRDAAEIEKDRVLTGEIEIIAAFVDGRIAAYFKLRKGTAEIELLQHPSNGQIKGAYGYPRYRGRGIGKALLTETVRWAKRNNLERLYVEGESANIYGGNFWVSHFHPAVYSVRRCVDDRINVDMFSDA